MGESDQEVIPLGLKKSMLYDSFSAHTGFFKLEFQSNNQSYEHQADIFELLCLSSEKYKFGAI